MFVYVYTARAKSPEAAQTVCRIFNHNLSLLQQPGFLRGDCAVRVEDPCQMIGLQYWGSREAMRFALGTETHRHMLEQMAPYLEGPPEATLYEVRG